MTQPGQLRLTDKRGTRRARTAARRRRRRPFDSRPEVRPGLFPSSRPVGIGNVPSWRIILVPPLFLLAAGIVARAEWNGPCPTASGSGDGSDSDVNFCTHRQRPFFLGLGLGKFHGQSAPGLRRLLELFAQIPVRHKVSTTPAPSQESLLLETTENVCFPSKWMIQDSHPGTRQVYVKIKPKKKPRPAPKGQTMVVTRLNATSSSSKSTTQSTSGRRVTSIVPTLSAANGPPFFQHSVLFRHLSKGYALFRLPTIVRTQAGTLIVFCEARKENLIDHGRIDIVYRRSVDDGRTWEPARLLIDGRGNTVGNPTPVADLRTGTVLLLFCRSPVGTRETSIREGAAPHRSVWVTKSLDDGLTWSYPVEITNSVRKTKWSWYATGPVHGIQLTSGRLLVPCNHVVGTSGAAGLKDRSHVIYSDDGGKNWRIGGVSTYGTNEATVVQLGNGSLYLNSRNMLRRKMRFGAWSHDNGQTFSSGRFEEELTEPSGNACQGSLLRVPFSDGKQDNNAGLILFANPETRENALRANMRLAYSFDDARTWVGRKIIFRGPAAYSDLALGSDGVINLVYERAGHNYFSEIIALDRFNLAWLFEGSSLKNKGAGDETRNN